MLRDTYAKIDKNAFAHNIKVLEKAAGTPLMAVVKADAYGHGVAEIVKKAWECGVKWFAVSNPDEAEDVRNTVPYAKILVLSYVMSKACDHMVQDGISVAVYRSEHIFEMQKSAEKLNKKAYVHLKADTGMGRIGFRTDEELSEVLNALSECPDVVLEGYFTHFASADEADLTFAHEQLDRYWHFREMIFAQGYVPLCHASNSAGIIALEDAHFDICRAGISMYGYPPSDEIDMKDMSLKPVMSLISYISYVKNIEAGSGVSYGRTFIAPGISKIATVPIGYADGYLRSLSNKAFAYINGKRVPQVGRVCMDQIMFDVTGIDVNEGDIIELFGEHVGADELAKQAGTISYELLTGITKRVPRVYIP